MFSLDSFTKATLTSVNPRAEIHGPERKPATDLHLQIKTSNAILSEFGSQLRDAIYWNSGEPAQQGELVDPVSDKPNLRNAVVEGPYKLKAELMGYALVIDHGLGGKSNLELGDVQVNAFKADCQEGGTVVLTFRVQAHPGEKESGKLAMCVGQEVDVKLLAPETTAELDTPPPPPAAKTTGKALDGTK